MESRLRRWRTSSTGSIGFPANSIETQYASYFADSITRNFNPAIRYSEVLLMNSEGHAKFLENDMTGINMVRARRGAPPTFTFDNNSLSTIQEWWRLEHYGKGSDL